MYLLLFVLFGAAAFICYTVMLVSFAMSIIGKDRKKLIFGIRYLLGAVMLTIAFGLVVQYMLNELFKNWQ